MPRFESVRCPRRRLIPWPDPVPASQDVFTPPLRGVGWFHALVLVAALAGLSNSLVAEDPPPNGREVQPGEEIFQVTARSSRITLVHLETRILELKNRIKIVDGFNQEKLTVSPLSPHRIRLRGESPGITTVKLIDEFDNVHVVEVFIEPDTRELRAYLERLFPGSSMEVVGMKDAVVLRGWVTDPTQIPQIIEVAEEFYPTVHPQLQVAGASQVQLHVKVLEVQRSKLRELGFNFLSLGNRHYVANTIGGIAPIGELAIPFGGAPEVTVLSQALQNPQMQFAITGNSGIFQGFIEALQREALAKIMAEPVLVTTSGRPASMLSGGKFPVPVPQGLGTVGIQWEEFGVRLEFVPIVLGTGRLRLDVAPEVSERDFGNATFIQGELVTGISVRRVNTQVEMRFGETLMIGGLISTRRVGTTSKVPFLGELPWLGAAFRTTSYNMTETELVILVTPQMVGPMMPHQVPPGGPGLFTDVPTARELYIDGMLEVPMFGPECPTCEPAVILPHGHPVPEYLPGPAAPFLPPEVPPAPGTVPDSVRNSADPAGGRKPADSDILPVSGTNPFRADVRRVGEPGAQSSANSPVSPKSPNSPSSGKPNDAKIGKDASLPGLIPPPGR